MRNSRSGCRHSPSRASWPALLGIEQLWTLALVLVEQCTVPGVHGSRRVRTFASSTTGLTAMLSVDVLACGCHLAQPRAANILAVSARCRFSQESTDHPFAPAAPRVAVCAGVTQAPAFLAAAAYPVLPAEAVPPMHPTGELAASLPCAPTATTTCPPDTPFFRWSASRSTQPTATCCRPVQALPSRCLNPVWTLLLASETCPEAQLCCP